MEEEDGRREAAIASAPSLQPNFIPKKGLNPTQISKFQELHRRRLKMKAKSKAKDKSKGCSLIPLHFVYISNGTRDVVEKYHHKDVLAKFKEGMDEKSIKTLEDPRITLSGSGMKDPSPSQEDKLALPKKRQKLHWGLDTKERWERKSNM